MIKRGEHVADEMIPEQMQSLREHVSIEVGIFCANLTNYLLSSGLDISYNLCCCKNKFYEDGRIPTEFCTKYTSCAHKF